VERVEHRMPDAGLVRCQAGLNRSALVAALALVHAGQSPQEAVDAIRAGRSLNCLFNRDFVQYLHERSLALTHAAGLRSPDGNPPR
jgi:protein-tyrosine phosphatase